MTRRTLSEVARLTGGALAGPDRRVEGAATDSREVRPGDLFVAIRGARVDGHDFVVEALERGAGGALVDGSIEGLAPLVVVPDTQAALLALGRDEGARRDATVVGVTGSSGKTSVKDLIASVLGTRMRVAASLRSFNTEVGVPLTLLNAPGDAEAIVCEMGARGRGDIALLVEVARPAVGVVTNVGPAHLERFGSIEGVADAKAELIEGLSPGGVAVLNADDPIVAGFAERTTARIVRYGLSRDADVAGEDLALDALARPSFTLRTPDGRERVDLALHGEHMAVNALAAAAAGVAMGLSPAECAAGLKEARPGGWRMEVTESGRGVRVINDAYNANPASTAAALKAAAWIARGGRCIAVLGEMAELGDRGPQEHERIGELVARLGIELLVTVGAGAAMIARGATREGVEPGRVVEAADPEAATAAVVAAAAPGDVVLVKGSRVAGLEAVAAALLEEGGA